MAPNYANLFVEYFDRHVINSTATYITSLVFSSICFICLVSQGKIVT